MMLFYSWKDIERYCLEKKDQWKNEFNNIEVYPTKLIIYRKKNGKKTTAELLGALFPKNFKKLENIIHLDLGDFKLPVFEQVEEEQTIKPYIPLFREVLYNETHVDEKKLSDLPCPIIAFHSYKGGVGRTLSLIAFAKAWTTVFEGTENQRLLIIDSDIEAPGLTWIQEMISENTFSYLDLMSLIQDIESVDEIVDLACTKIGTALLPIESKKSSVDHIFVPTYRYINQLLDLYASPLTIVNVMNKAFAIGDVLSQIGKKLGVGAILIDLRAGLSELSAPVLLDPRIKKYLITSTSQQSVSGTVITLDFLTKGLKIGAETLLPEIFLTMVTDSLTDETKRGIYEKLIGAYYTSGEDDTDDYIDNVITELPFASELIYLTTINQIVSCLNERDMYFRIESLVKENYKNLQPDNNQVISVHNREQRLKCIRETASEQIAAESNSRFNLMMTAPIKNLRQQYSDVLPTTIIMGAKGSGKTFLYIKLLEAGDWASFFKKINEQDSKIIDINAEFIPVLATRNLNNMHATMKKCIMRVNSSIQLAKVNDGIYLDNARRIELRKMISDWYTYWENMLASSFNSEYNRLLDVEEALEKEDKRIVYLLDGLEDYFQNVIDSVQGKEAIQSLCQDIVQRIKTSYSRIGIIVFLRRDLAQNAITVNFTQFRKVYEKTELKWSSNEALRLALWLVKQADESFYNENVDISVATQEIVDHYLEQLWGLKLGKPSSNEAYSSRWILAALSDFNGQLQARDIIRFLQYAANDNGKRPPYDDRLLMPADIKKAVQNCSIDKMNEIKEEYVTLKPIFEKLENLPESQKVVPLCIKNNELSSQDETSLVQEGYLKRDGDAYYLPEIVRYALGFKYEKGARPKVVSLVPKHAN